MRSDTMKRGLERAPHRSLFKALGLTDREIDQPMIGIANSANEVIPGHLHLHQISEAVKAGIRMAGGTPLEFFTIGVCDGIVMGHEGMKYSLSSRELIADSVESMAMAYPFDGLVLIPNCDKIVPGMLMAAARLNIPTIVISGGPMLSGEFQGKRTDLIKVFEYVGKVKVGEMTMDELSEAEGCACPGVGSCAGMFTANSMNCLTEVLGMGLPGNGTIPAVWAERIRLAKEAGMQVMELVEKNLRPSDILTLKAFENALSVDLAFGGSTNTSLHLPAIAKEAGVPLSLETFNTFSDKTPHLCFMSPGGPHDLFQLHQAGGIPALMQELSGGGMIHKDAMTVTGKTVGENLAKRKVLDPEVIRPLENPYHKTGGLAVLFGNLAPEGAVVKSSAVDDTMLRIPARPASSTRKSRPCRPSWTGRSIKGTSSSSATKARRAAPACARCSPRPPPSSASAGTRTWRSSPTAASRAAAAARRSATSLRRRPKGDPSPPCWKATGSRSTSRQKN